jgi:hypothetical protein
VANEYATLAELKEARQIPDADTQSDEALERALTRASRAIDTRTGRRFYKDGVVSNRTYYAPGKVVWQSSAGTYALLTDDISTGVGLLVSGAAPDHTWPDNAIARGRAIESISIGAYGTNAIVVTADWGWPAIPEEIKEATLLLANRRYGRKDSPEGVSGWANEGPIRVSRFDPDIEDLVEPFVIPGFGA